MGGKCGYGRVKVHGKRSVATMAMALKVLTVTFTSNDKSLEQLTVASLNGSGFGLTSLTASYGPDPTGEFSTVYCSYNRSTGYYGRRHRSVCF